MDVYVLVYELLALDSSYRDRAVIGAGYNTFRICISTNICVVS